MRKKTGLIAFVFILVLQTVLSGAVPYTAIAKGLVQSIFTDVKLTNSHGEVIDAAQKPNQQVDLESAVNVTFDWTLEESQVGEGDTYSFLLPDQLKAQSQYGVLTASDNAELGTFQVADRTVTVTFNDQAGSRAAAGNIMVAAAFNKEVIGEKEETSISFDLKGETKVIPVVFKPEEKAETDAVVQKDTELNTDEKKEETDEGKIREKTSEKNEENVEQESAANGEIAAGPESQSQTKETAKNKKTTAKAVQTSNSEKHGFYLMLNQVTDLEDKKFDSENLLNPADEFKLKLKWNLEDGHNYVKGDKEIFHLPNGIKIIEEMTGELENAAGLVVANYKISTDKKVELTFTDFVETHSNIEGWLEIISMLDEENVEVEDGEAIIEPIGEEGEIRIPINRGNIDKTIEKKGTPNKGYNADEIHWEIIINKNKTSLINAKVTDVLPQGTEYKEGSLKVTKLRADLNGNILGDAGDVAVSGEKVAEGMLTIPLGNIKDAYRVEYITTVTDDEEKTFVNNATLTDGNLDDVSAVTTATINRGEAIKKKAAKKYNPKTGIIEWEIEFNYNEKNLTDAILEDKWKPEGKLELVNNSLKFTEVEIDENGKAHNTGNVGLPAGAQVVKGTDQFQVTGITTDKAYKVTYQTKVTGRVLESFDIANTAGFGTATTGSGTHVGTYYGSKSAGTVDYKNKTIDWTIEINHDEYPMKNISIKDTLGEGLSLKEGTLEVTVDGKKYEGYSLSGENTFTLQFPEDFTTDKKIVITYQTDYVADEVPNHKPTNKAAITWTPEGGNESITKEVEASTELNKNTKNNHWKNGSYDPASKEITWTIYTNYRENQIDNLIVTDAPQGNQKIISDSVKVKELEIDTNGKMTEVNQLDANVASIDTAANTLKVTIGNTNKAYKIEYKTTLAGLSDIQKEYVNQAEVLNGGHSLSVLTAKVGIAKHDTYGEKSGYQDGKQVHWSVKVNLGQQKVSNLKLEDTISDNQEYLANTIKVYHAAVDAKGNATKGEEVQADQYKVEYTPGKQKFTIEWLKEVERAFIVEYSTLFFEKHNGEVTNTYKVTGGSISEGDNTDGNGTVTIRQLSSGGGSGEAGYLVIDKVDVTYGRDEAKLKGAEFDLIDPDTKKILKTGKTNENGHIDFGRLLFGEYELHERVVPDGYVMQKERQTITIGKKYKHGNEETKTTYRVENYEPVFAIELSKTDNKKKALPGATFTLFDSDRSKITESTTGTDGKILFEDLKEAGTYYVKETEAPAGFILNTKEYKVTVGDKERAPVKVTATNTPRGAVLLQKIDTDTKKPLQGVQFELQKLNRNGEYVTVESFTTDDKGQIKTSNTLEAGEYQFIEAKTLDGYRTNDHTIKFKVNVNDAKTQQFTMENERYKGSIKLIKKDAATEAMLAGAEYKLLNAKGETIKENLKTNAKGAIIIEDILLGGYQLIETKAPAGYELDETPVDLEITEDKQVVEATMVNHKIMDISVKKKWNNAGGETTPVTIKLLPTNKIVELNEENGWRAVFKDLHVYDQAGEKINYQVEEIEIDGYQSNIKGNANDGFIVTNTETTNVSGKKIWLDDDAEDRPNSITIHLFANDEKTDQSVEVSGPAWTYEFTDLEKYDETGQQIVYTVEEENIEGYESKIEGSDITNLRVGKTSVEGIKTWKDDNSKDRPEMITVNLLQNGEKIEEHEVSAAGDWTYSFTELDKYDQEGKAYTYTVEEEPVKGYETTIKDYDITNLRVGKTSIEGTKTWKDDNSKDRPNTITVNLLQNGEKIDSQEVSASADWTYSFPELDKYDQEGKAYTYTVEEEPVKGYETTIKDYDITNLRVGKTSVDGTKIWKDDNSKDRLDTITVNLLQNGEKIDSQEVSASADWTYSFPGLENYDQDGKTYTYTVEEEPVKGYETTIKDYDITNLRVGKTSIEGTKTWKDDNSKERPETITVHLLQNGERINSQEVSANVDWTYSFPELEKYDREGKAYTYTVKEASVKGYETTIGGYDITNLRVGKTSVEGMKTWKDGDSKGRPEMIKVNLLQNGVVKDTKEVTAETDWKYSFTDLEKYDGEGVIYEYDVKEHGVPGYKSEVDGYDITNTRSEKTSVTITKGWKDDNSESRPDSVTVTLLQNGQEYETVEVKASENWTYEFNDLEAFDEKGVAYKYTVEEKPVKGYEMTITGFDITNLRIGKTSVEGTKTWKDDDSNDRSGTITVNLLQNGKKVDSQVVSAKADWKYIFTNLAQYDQEGKAYTYTVKEDPVEGYKSTVDGYDITNLRVGKTAVEGTKTWKDDDSNDRSGTITVNLLQNGKKVDSQVVSAKADWKYIFTNLAKYDQEGKAYTYTVKEDPVEGYESTVDGYDITNLRVGTTSIEGTKTWDDNQFKNRPKTIKVDLLQNGKVTDTKEVTGENDWKYAFADLPKYDQEGKVYHYSVKEQAVKGYESVVTGNDITNKLILGDVQLIKVAKGNHEVTLAEAEFRLEDSNGEEIKDGLVTDQNGRLEVRGLMPGDYQFVETKAPKGYQKSEKPVSFTIEQDQREAAYVLVENAPITPVFNPNPDSDPNPDLNKGQTAGVNYISVGGTAIGKPGSHLGGRNSGSKGSGGLKLPNTATSLFNYMLAGIVLVLLGLLLARFTRKKQQ